MSCWNRAGRVLPEYAGSLCRSRRAHVRRRPLPRSLLSRLVLILTAHFVLAPSWLHADVVFDGSLPGSTPGSAADGVTPTGGIQYTVDAADGVVIQDSGGTSINVLQSLSELDLDAMDELHFTADGLSGVDRVISRVTGGSASRIDGAIRSAIEGADLYIVNPFGIDFGASSSTLVDGSFFVTSAEQVHFANGETFDAWPGGQVPTVAFDAPVAFGFLGASSGLDGRISVQGEHTVPDGEGIHLLGRGIAIEGDGLGIARTLRASHFSFVSIDPAETSLSVGVGSAGLQAPGDANAARGPISMSARSRIETSLDPMGSVVIRGGQLTLDGGSLISGGAVDADLDRLELLEASVIRSETRFDLPGGDITIRARDSVLLSGRRFDPDPSDPELDNLIRSDVYSYTGGAGRGGDIVIETPELLIENAASIRSQTTDDGTAHGGDIDLRVDRLGLFLQGEIGTATSTVGDAGDIIVTASERIDIVGVLGLPEDELPVGDRVQFTGIKSSDQTRPQTGATGDIVLTTPDLVIQDGGVISTASLFEGDGGDVVIEADRVRVLDSGVVDASTLLLGRGGEVRIEASESVLVRGQHPDAVGPSRIGASSLLYGDAGAVRITTPLLVVDGGVIETSTLGFDGIELASFSWGGTDIRSPELNPLIKAELAFRLGLALEEMPGEDDPLTMGLVVGAILTNLNLSGPFQSGAAGDIQINVDSLLVQGGGEIDTTSFSAGNAGRIEIHAQDAVAVSGVGSGIYSRLGSSGAGGGVVIAAPLLTLGNAAEISIESGQLQPEVARFFGAVTELYEGLVDTKDLLVGGDPFIQANLGLEFLELSEVVYAPGSSTGTGGGQADAGNLEIAGRRLRMTDSRISAGAVDALGGSVFVDVTEAVILDGATINADVNTTTGGSVDIRADGGIAMLGGSAIEASALTGLESRGGNIAITTPLFVSDPTSVLSATAPGGAERQGNVAVNAPESYLQLGAPSEVAEYLDASMLFAPQCGARTSGEQVGSLKVTHRFEALSNVSGLLEPKRLDSDSERAEIQVVLSEAPMAPEPAPGMRTAVPDSVKTSVSHDDVVDGARAAEAEEASLAAALFRRGRAHHASGDVDAAWVDHLEAVEAARESGEIDLELRARANLARTLLEAARVEDAFKESERAMKRLREFGLGEAFEIEVHLARTLAGIARSDRSLRDQALLEAYSLAIHARDGAAGASDERALAQALGELGRLYEIDGRSQTAIRLSREAAQAAERGAQWDLLVLEWQREASLLQSRGDREAALELLRRSVRMLAEIRPEASITGSTVFDVGGAYRSLTSALLDASNEREGLAQQVLLRDARATMEGLKAAELREYYRDECVVELGRKERRLEEVDPTAAIVYPMLLDDRLEVLVTAADGITRYSVDASPEAVRGAVASLRRNLQDPRTRRYKRPARQIYDWIVAPWAAELHATGIETLVFVPDALFGTIPMAALQSRRGPLVQDFAVVVSPGLELVDPQPLDARSARVLAVGLTGEVQGLPALEFVEQELDQISELFDTTTLVDADFTRPMFAERIVDERPTIIHVASHARFGGSNADSFLLTHSDRISIDQLGDIIATTRFAEEPIELLTLSACETAFGDEGAALGLAGVAIRSGARSALGTLWRVSDDAASALVRQFYRELSKGDVSKAEALRRAQISLMGDGRHAHPFYWSAYLLVSNWL